MTISDPFLSQTANQALFVILFNKALIPDTSQGQSEALCPVEQELSMDEENTLRYISGYALFKLITKFRSASSERNATSAGQTLISNHHFYVRTELRHQ